MEQGLIDFDEWIATRQKNDIKYYAVFDINGQVLGIYPEHAVTDKENKIVVESSIADKICQGVIHLHHCSVDILKKKFLITEKSNQKDNVLHRITEKTWSSDEYFDLYIEYNYQNKILTVALTERFGGTKKDIDTPSVGKLFNDNQIEILLYFTDYNDPNILFYTVKLSLIELYDTEQIFNNLELPKKFSVYTRRYFDNYVLELT